MQTPNPPQNLIAFKRNSAAFAPLARSPLTMDNNLKDAGFVFGP
jgi:hypothetical protein